MVTSMLEKAIEIEGLLRIIRDGKPLPETYKLLDSKAASLAMEITVLAEKAQSHVKKEQEPKQEVPEVDFVMATPSAGTETSKVDFTEAAATPKEQMLIIQKEAASVVSTTSPDLTEVDLDLAEEDDIILSFDDLPEQTSTTEETAEPTKPQDALTEQPANTEETDQPAETQDDDTDYTQEMPEESIPEETHAEETLSEETHAEETRTAEKQPEAAKRQTKLKAAFSLNDRFLYARELFNGNMKIFDSTLDFIEGIGEYALVEDYFYSELDWDPENPNVTSFMEILRPQFKE